MRIMIIEDNDILREKIGGLASRLETVSTVCLVKDCEKLPGVIADMKPGVVLIDLNCAKDFLEEIRDIKNTIPGTRVIALLENSDVQFGAVEMSRLMNADALIEKKKLFSDLSNILVK